MPPEGAAVDGFAPAWAAPAGVGAWMSTRRGGVSNAPWASLNLGERVGDDAEAVAENRRRFSARLGGPPVWLRQVHGATVVDAAMVAPGELPAADGLWTDQPGIACVVQVADCMPVLFASKNGRAVGAAHAGWRGLAGGVLEATLAAVAAAAGVEPAEVVAWLGPCIGPRHFQVGADVLEAFGESAALRFVPTTSPDERPRWLADLPALAGDRLQAAGVQQVADGAACTVGDASSFFSFRRDGVTGRLGAAVWLER